MKPEHILTIKKLLPFNEVVFADLALFCIQIENSINQKQAHYFYTGCYTGKQDLYQIKYELKCIPYFKNSTDHTGLYFSLVK